MPISSSGLDSDHLLTSQQTTSRTPLFQPPPQHKLWGTSDCWHLYLLQLTIVHHTYPLENIHLDQLMAYNALQNQSWLLTDRCKSFQILVLLLPKNS